MKSFGLKLLSLLMAAALVLSLMTACTGKKGTNEADNAPPSSESEIKSEASAPEKEEEEVVGKYANMETYEKDGVKYGKTESGKEVAISGQNMQKLLEEYQKVQGTDSEKERDLLDQLQVILDNAQTAE